MENTMTEARADALMEDGFHCSQCVFPYAAFRLGMDRDEALRLSAGLGGGCFHGDSCGAVTGAAMALSIASKVSSISIILGYLFGSTSRTEIFPSLAFTGSLQSDLSKEIDLNPILSTK